MIKRQLGCLLSGMLAALMIAAGAAESSAADLGAKDETIKLAMLEWTGAHVSTHIAGQFLEKLGYKVEYVTAGNFRSSRACPTVRSAPRVEVWLNNVGDIFPKALADKKIEISGRSSLRRRKAGSIPNTWSRSALDCPIGAR